MLLVRGLKSCDPQAPVTPHTARCLRERAGTPLDKKKIKKLRMLAVVPRCTSTRDQRSEGIVMWSRLRSLLLVAVPTIASIPSEAAVPKFQGLGDLPGGPVASMAWDASADGSVIVGGSNTAAGMEAFRWTSTGGMVGLGLPPGGSLSQALGVSGDGSVIAGNSINAAGKNEAFRWTPSGGIVGLGDLPGGVFQSGATGGVSADG